MRFVLLSGAAAIVMLIGASDVAIGQSPSFDRFSEYSEASNTHVDYEAWTLILRNIVFDVGHSDRRPAMSRGVVTGTLINPESSSRYRHEGNRVVYHLMEDIHDETLSQYREELSALPDSLPLASLNSNEQLAYWLNLHNAVLIDELNKAYPVRRVDRVRVDGEPLFDAKLVTIEGQPLSLNDIRFRIVAENWPDPRIMYGFFLGAVGGPSLRDEAFTGTRVWSQLESNAREYVNALRGVDEVWNNPRLSPLYEDYAALFPGGRDQLVAHLQAFGDEEVDALVSEIEAEPRYLDFDWSIADLTNGRNGCSGALGAVNLDVVSGDTRTSAAIDCNTLPPQAAALVDVVIQRRLEFLRNGELGRVVVRDIETEDPDDRDPSEGRRNDGSE